MTKLWKDEEFDWAGIIKPNSTLLFVLCSDRRFVKSLVDHAMNLEEVVSNLRVYPAVLPGFAMGMSDRTDSPSYRPAFIQTMKVVQPNLVILFTHVGFTGRAAGCHAAMENGLSDEDNVRRTILGAQCIRNQYEIPVIALTVVPTGLGNAYTLHELV